MPFSIPVTVEFEDVDSYKILHHPKLVAYLERARVRFIRHLNIELFQGQVAPVVYELKVRFRKPALLMDELLVSVDVETFNGFRLVIGYKVTRGKDTIALASSTLAFIDLENKRISEAPAKYREAIDSFMTKEKNG
jgi:acyl-CoA thioester hydrolase